MARRKARARRSGIFSRIVLVCAVLVVLAAVQRQWRADSALQRSIDSSLRALAGQPLTLPAARDLEILSTPEQRRSAAQIERMLRSTGDKNGTFLFSDKQVGTYAMSAQALDRRQHLVNTFLEGYEPFKVDSPALPLYVLARRKSYEYDRVQYAGRQDVWQSSRQAFFYPRGDCEDHAILLADWLISMGEDARVVVGEMHGEGHAWVALFRDGQEYLLEATQKRGLSRNKPYPLAALFTDYAPRYMFNREYFWENTGSPSTTSYSGGNWQKKSRLRFEPAAS